MTVGELAVQLGITVKEAMALCRVAGIPVVDAASELKPKQVQKVHAVLAGQARMLNPDELAGKAPLGSRTGKRRGGATAAIVVVLLLVLVGVGFLGLSSLRSDTDINVVAGDCFNASLFSGTVFGSSIEASSCETATYRAFAVLELDEVFTEWPGRDVIEERARARCLAIAPAGVDLGDAGLTPIYYFGPGDETAWNNPAARKIVCAEAN